jgi:hypothetical protein
MTVLCWVSLCAQVWLWHSEQVKVPVAQVPLKVTDASDV